MKYLIEVQGDSTVGIESESHEVTLTWSFGPDDYDIEFYNALEKDFIELLREHFDNGTRVTVTPKED